MILGYIIRSWETYRRNIINFIIAELLSLTISGIIALIGAWIIFGSIGISNLISLSSPEMVITRIASILSFLAELFVALIFFIIAGIVWSFLKVGIYGIVIESFRGETKFQTMFSIAKKSGFKGVVSSIIVGLISFILFVILVIILNIIIPIIGAIIGLILFFSIIITFSLIYPGIVEDDLSSTQAIKVSFNIAKKKYFELFVLVIFFTLVSLVLIIPTLFNLFFLIFGVLIYSLVIAPMLKISLVFFYKRNKF
jgi:hypothetical protein